LPGFGIALKIYFRNDSLFFVHKDSSPTTTHFLLFHEVMLKGNSIVIW